MSTIRLFFLALFAALLAAPAAADTTQQGNLRAKQAEMTGHLMDMGITEDKHYIGTEMETMNGDQRRSHMGKKAKDVVKAIGEALHAEASVTATAQIGFSLCVGGGVAGNVDIGIKVEASVEIKYDQVKALITKIHDKFKEKNWSKLTKAFKTLETWFSESSFKAVLKQGGAQWQKNAQSGVSTAESGHFTEPAKLVASAEFKLGIVVSPVSGGIPVPTFSLKGELSLSAAILKTQDPPFGLDWGKTLDGDTSSDGSLGCIAELKASVTVGTSGVATSASGPAKWKCVGALVALLWEIVKAWVVKNFSGTINKVNGAMQAVSNKLTSAKGSLVKTKNDATACLKEKAAKMKKVMGFGSVAATVTADPSVDTSGSDAGLDKGLGHTSKTELEKQSVLVDSMIDEACDGPTKQFEGTSQCDAGDDAADKNVNSQPALKKMSGFFKGIFKKLGGNVNGAIKDAEKQSGWGFSLNFGVGLGDMSPGIKIYYQWDIKASKAVTTVPDNSNELDIDGFSAEINK